MLFSFVLLNFLNSMGLNAASTADVTLPHILTSVDGYKTVCPGETIYLTCSTSNAISVSWTSPSHVGENAAIEFNQNFDRPGVGKLMSLPHGRSTLAQMVTTERNLTSNLKITIPRNLNETNVTCANNHRAAVTKSFMLVTQSPTPQTFLPTELIAENLPNHINVYRFRWQLPANIENIDLKHIKFQVDEQPPMILTNTSTEIILPLSYGQHSVNIVAVDRCDRQSQPTVLQLQVQKSATDSTYLSDSSDVPLIGGLSSARSINSMLNILLVLISLLAIYLTKLSSS